MINRKPNTANRFTADQNSTRSPFVQQQALLALVVVTLLLLTPGPLIEAIKSWLSWPPAEPSASGFPVDKVVHFIMFAVCAWLNLRAWGRMIKPLYVLMALAGFAALTEILQMLVPGRSGDLPDFFADAAGLVTAYVCYRYQNR